jgi:two-component system alkaline phosphatase synthesis response regulator PhoP
MIYCVEDDAAIRELIVYTLENTGFRAVGFDDGAALLHALETELPELILMDIMLPGEDGVSLLKKIRADERTGHIAVIMLTAKGSEYDKVLALDLGADDYVTKPFGMVELLSRIRAVLRRTGRQKQEEGRDTLVVRDLTLDTARHRVYVGGIQIILTLKEFELLRNLMTERGVVLSRDALLQKIWGYDFDGETRTVDVHIRSLRQKLGTAGDMIETVRGVGYRLAAD